MFEIKPWDPQIYGRVGQQRQLAQQGIRPLPTAGAWGPAAIGPGHPNYMNPPKPAGATTRQPSTTGGWGGGWGGQQPQPQPQQALPQSTVRPPTPQAPSPQPQPPAGYLQQQQGTWQRQEVFNELRRQWEQDYRLSQAAGGLPLPWEKWLPQYQGLLNGPPQQQWQWLLANKPQVQDWLPGKQGQWTQWWQNSQPAPAPPKVPYTPVSGNVAWGRGDPRLQSLMEMLRPA